MAEELASDRFFGELLEAERDVVDKMLQQLLDRGFTLDQFTWVYESGAAAHKRRLAFKSTMLPIFETEIEFTHKLDDDILSIAEDAAKEERWDEAVKIRNEAMTAQATVRGRWLQGVQT